MRAGREEAELVFGRWRLLPAGRRLLADGAPVPLGSRAFDLLLALVEARGELVTKDALMRQVWPGTTVEENNLQVQVSALRKAFGEEGPRLIATVPGRGYRFTGETEPAAAGAARGGPSSAPGSRASLAVMPFRNLGGGPDDDRFADGMVEDLITALSRIRWFFVIAGSSSLTYRGRAVPAPQIGRELGVRYVIEGAVRRGAGARLRVNVELVETATGAPCWAERFDGAADDAFAMQDRLVASIVAAVEPSLQRAEIERVRRIRPTEAPHAYEAYLRALGQMHPMTEANCAAALGVLEGALAADPGFALALAVAAWCRMWRISQGFADGAAREEAGRAIAQAEAAATAAPDDPTVLARAGIVFAYLAHRRPAAVAMAERAVALTPNSALTRTSAGWTLLYEGEAEAAIEHFAEALRLDPVSPDAGNAMAGSAFAELVAGRPGRAVDCGLRAVAASPDLLTAHRALVAALGAAGMPASAALARLLALDPGFNLADYARLRGGHVGRPLFARANEGLRRAGVPERPGASRADPPS